MNNNLRYLTTVRVCTFLLCTTLVAFFPGCVSNGNTFSEAELVEKEAEFRTEAIRYADDYKIQSYQFLGIELFQTLDVNNLIKGRRMDGLTLYHTVNHSQFDEIAIGVDDDNIALRILAFKYLENERNADIFLAQLRAVTMERFPLMKRLHEKHPLYYVYFNPREAFINKYVETQMDDFKNGQTLYRSPRMDRWATMADSELHSIQIMPLQQDKDGFPVTFEVLTNRAVEIGNADKNNAIDSLSEEVFSTKD